MNLVELLEDELFALGARVQMSDDLRLGLDFHTTTDLVVDVALYAR